jgi:hypothetical protein
VARIIERRAAVDTWSPVTSVACRATREELATMAQSQAGLIVFLDDGVGPADAEAVAVAIRMLKGVAGVQTADASPDLEAARERVNAEWRERIVGLLDDEGV